MEAKPVEQVHKRQIRWIRFFAFAIILASVVNIVNTAGILISVAASRGAGQLTAEAIRLFGLNVLTSTLLVVFSLAVFFLRMPLAVRVWERKEWGRRLMLWLAFLSIAVVPISYALTNASGGLSVQRKIYLLLEGVVFNTVVILYFSRSKIKSIFVK